MIYDISPLITKKTKTWTGDVGYSYQKNSDLKNGDHSTCSSINTTVHLCSHADAPCHILEGEKSIAECSLENYLGECQVIRPEKLIDGKIDIGSLENKTVSCRRVLFATETFQGYENWNNNFAYFTTDLVTHLISQGVILAGIDTPSVDSFFAKDLNVHKLMFKNKIAILEGLVLKDIPEGFYELIALPLRLEGLDASPVRAILRDLKRS